MKQKQNQPEDQYWILMQILSGWDGGRYSLTCQSKLNEPIIADELMHMEKSC